MHCRLTVQAAQHALSPASSLGLSEAQSLGAASPKLAQTEHLLRNAPGRAASGLSRAFETGPPTLQRDPQIASPHSQVPVPDWAQADKMISQCQTQLVAIFLYHEQLVPCHACLLARVAQVVRRSGNPWHSRPAADAQATCTVGKPFGQPVHAVHAFSMAWPPQPQPNKVCSCRSFQAFLVLSCSSVPDSSSSQNLALQTVIKLEVRA